MPRASFLALAAIMGLAACGQSKTETRLDDLENRTSHLIDRAETIEGTDSDLEERIATLEAQIAEQDRVIDNLQDELALRPSTRATAKQINDARATLREALKAGR